MKTIAIANQKGGTGKTTTAYNLGIALTQQGYRVLMVDFDPQGNLSCYCGIPPEQDLEQTITELLMKVAYEKPLSRRECVYQSKRTDESAPQVDFIPSNLRLASFELAMGTMMCREVLLKTCLEQYSSQYDYCIIDCSPSVGLLLTNALSAANEVIIPMQAQPFSVVGMSQLTNSISNVQRKINPGLHIRGILLTMTQHTKVSEHYAHDVRAKYGRTLRVFTTEIPYNVKVQESQAFAAPTILYEPKSSSARAYVDFTQEVLGQQKKTEKETVAFLKKEYGIGGFSWTFADGGSGFVNFDGKGFSILYDFKDDLRYEKKLKWKEVGKRLEYLVRMDRYLTDAEREKMPAWINRQAESKPLPPPIPDQKPVCEVGSTVYLENDQRFTVESIGQFDIHLRNEDFPLVGRAVSREQFQQLLDANPRNGGMVLSEQQRESLVQEQREQALSYIED